MPDDGATASLEKTLVASISQTLFDASPLAIVISRGGKLLYVNRTFREFYRIGDPLNLSGRSILDYIAPSSRPFVAEQNARRERNQPAASSYETIARRDDGTEFPVHISAGRVDLPDGPATIVFIKDISERKRVEEQLLQSQKMEAIGVLAGGVAHDFNNLLAVISGYSESLMRRLGDGHELYAHAAEIQRASERGVSLVRQLLAFSRRQTAQPQIVDLSRVVFGLHEMLRRVIRHEIDVKLLPLEFGLLVKADPGHLEQVVLNLALNARDAMAAGGTLTIATERSDRSNDAPGPWATLRISDTGIGMDEQTRLRMFEPFFTTKGLKGTGLGLAVVYGVVQQYGGRIDVRSAPGEGTEVTVLLPIMGDDSNTQRM